MSPLLPWPLRRLPATWWSCRKRATPAREPLATRRPLSKRGTYITHIWEYRAYIMRISSSQRDERLMAKGCGGAYHAYQTISERYQTYITLYRGTLVGSVRGGEWMLQSGVPWGGQWRVHLWFVVSCHISSVYHEISCLSIRQCITYVSRNIRDNVSKRIRTYQVSTYIA